jgi:hypothetical protein
MRPSPPRRSLAADEPRTATELIARVQTDWAALEFVVASLSEEQLTIPLSGGWAIKDHLAHIAEWERATTAVLARRPQSEGFGLDAATYARLTDVDQINELIYQRNRDLTISVVQSSARAAHADVLAALGALTDADVQNTIAGYGGDPTDNRPLLAKIAGATYGHYAEHTGWIQEQLASKRS